MFSSHGLSLRISSMSKASDGDTVIGDEVPFILLEDDGNRHGDVVTSSDVIPCGQRRCDEKQRWEIQREIDSNLFVWSFLHAVSTSTLEPAFRMVGEGIKCLNSLLNWVLGSLSSLPRLVAWVLLRSVSTGNVRSIRTTLAWSTCPTRPPMCPVQPLQQSSFPGMRGRDEEAALNHGRS